MNYKLSYDELNERLRNQTNLLIDLCLQFDKGNYDYADVISTKIGAIINFHDKDSILPNMKKQDSIKFCSSSKVLNTTYGALMYRTMVATVKNNEHVQYFPKFDNGKYPYTWHNFKIWADSPIFIINLEPNQRQLNGLIYVHDVNEKTQLKLSRKDIINFYRNKYGGAHHDDRMKERFYLIASGLSSIEHIDHPDTKYSFGEKYKPGDPIKYLFEMAVRQIAHELIVTIRNSFDFDIKYKPLYQNFTNKRPKELEDVLLTFTKGENGQKQVSTRFI